MNERSFVNQKREDWERLAALVSKAQGRRGLRALNREEVLAFGALYRRVSSDLAYARGRVANDDLIAHLNRLVGQAHALLYEAETSGNAARSVVHFYAHEFPALLQRHIAYFGVSVLVSMLGAVFAYWLVRAHPDALTLFVPKGFEESVEAWKSGKMQQEPMLEAASWYMTHNFQVGMLSFATGFLVGIPTLYLLFFNGGMMGAMSALMTQEKQHANFWPGILPHGIAELTAIFICGAAGFLLAKALLLPGSLTREDALKLAGLNAVKLALGTIPLFIFAGIIEAMFSRLEGASATLRYVFAALNGIVWYLYLFLPRRGQFASPKPDLARNLQSP